MAKVAKRERKERKKQRLLKKMYSSMSACRCTLSYAISLHPIPWSEIVA